MKAGVYATGKRSTAWENAFCVTISWLEVYFEDKVWIVEADEESGRLMLLGDQELCREFNDKAIALTTSVEDSLNKWSYYGGD